MFGEDYQEKYIAIEGSIFDLKTRMKFSNRNIYKNIYVSYISLYKTLLKRMLEVVEKKGKRTH